MAALSLSEAQERMRICGFVNITNLPYYNIWDEEEEDNIKKIQASPSQYGCWVFDRTYCFVITEDGEVWMRYGMPANELVFLVAPQGEGSQVFFADGDRFSDVSHIFERLADPFSNIGGEFPPTPQPEHAR